MAPGVPRPAAVYARRREEFQCDAVRVTEASATTTVRGEWASPRRRDQHPPEGTLRRQHPTELQRRDSAVNLLAAKMPLQESRWRGRHCPDWWCPVRASSAEYQLSPALALARPLGLGLGGPCIDPGVDHAGGLTLDWRLISFVALPRAVFATRFAALR